MNFEMQDLKEHANSEIFR